MRPTVRIVTALSIGTALLVSAAYGLALRWPPAGLLAAAITVALAVFVVWRTAQAAAIARRGIEKVTLGAGMVGIRGKPARVPLIAPSLLRSYGLRSAMIFAIMILSLAASTFMLREATTGPVIGGRKGYAGDFGLAAAGVARRRTASSPRRTATSTSPIPTTT
jgi:hypothetical protein